MKHKIAFTKEELWDIRSALTDYKNGYKRCLTENLSGSEVTWRKRIEIVSAIETKFIVATKSNDNGILATVRKTLELISGIWKTEIKNGVQSS